MIGFTTSTTISELINKRPLKKRKGRRRYKMPIKGDLRAVQKILKLKGRK
tara:strand:+ start:198 stop:347 length:150 start_codon:yes stop_codon:yes gene_type:complete